MSDANDTGLRELKLTSGHTDGGHEHDSHNNKALFAMLFGLFVLIVGMGIGVYQLFRTQSSAIMEAEGAKVSPMLHDYQERVGSTLGQYGVIDKAAGRYRVPVESAMDLVLKDPSRLEPGAPPAKWVHPDDEGKAKPN